MKLVDLKSHKALGNLEGATPTDNQITTLYQVHRRMMIMAFAISKAGNFQVKCTVNGETTMAPLDVNLNYVFDAYERAVALDSVEWLKERDVHTRTLMVSFMRDGLSQGAALK